MFGPSSFSLFCRRNFRYGSRRFHFVFGSQRGTFLHHFLPLVPWVEVSSSTPAERYSTRWTHRLQNEPLLDVSLYQSCDVIVGIEPLGSAAQRKLCSGSLRSLFFLLPQVKRKTADVAPVYKYSREKSGFFPLWVSYVLYNSSIYDISIRPPFASHLPWTSYSHAQNAVRMRLVEGPASSRTSCACWCVCGRIYLCRSACAASPPS